MRALPLVYPDDPTFAACDLEYLFGPDLLVAPIYNAEGTRPVVFPPGVWMDFWSKDVIHGSVTRHVQYGLDQFPLYVRADALIPTMQPRQTLGEEQWDVVFEAYMLEAGRTVLRDTDGVTEIAVSVTGANMNVVLNGAKEVVGLRLIPLRSEPIDTVTLNGAQLQMQDVIGLDAISPSAWTIGPDGTVVALLHARRRFRD
jgi:alpha-D-xyloside xylohydrolase